MIAGEEWQATEEMTRGTGHGKARREMLDWYLGLCR